MQLLIKILKDRKNRVELIRQFQEYIWNESPKFISDHEENILSELAYDLDFYQPDVNIRKEDPSYYGDDRLETEIITALQKLGITSY